MLRALPLAFLLALICPGTSLAQTIHKLAPLESVDEKEHVKVTVDSFHPGASTGGYGYVHLSLHNPGPTARSIAVEVRDAKTDGSLISVRSTVLLEPTTTTLRFLPFPCSGLSADLSLSIDGLERALQRLDTGSSKGGIHCLSITDRADYPTRIDTLVASANLSHSGHVSRLVRIAAPLISRTDQLPPSWTMLTGFNLVALDGECTGLDNSVQTLLVQFVQGGGNLLITSAATMPKGALRDLIDHRTEPGATGLGRVFGLEPALAKSPATTGGFTDWLIGKPHSCVSAGGTDIPGPAPYSLYHTLPVPGVAGLPTHIFFLIIFAFVFVIGPVNHILLRKRGKPWLVLITVPLAGFLVTGFILGYAILAEGFGAHAIAHSISVLDQRTHSSSTTSTRTFFAGLSPTYLAPATDSFVYARSQLIPDPKTPKYQLDADTTQIDGAILPSRRPSNFVWAAVETCRERLQLQPSSLSYRCSQGLVPYDRAGAVIVRDRKGQYYLSDSATSLHTIPVRAAELAIREHMELFKPFGASSSQIIDWLEDRLGASLEPGTYIGRFQTAPIEDGLGLPSVTYGRTTHLVLGILAEKDILK